MPSHRDLIQSLQQFCIDQNDGFESVNQSTIQLVANYIAGLKTTTKKEKKQTNFINNYFFIKQK